MKFVDTAKVHLVAGNGGNGCVAFRREKFVPHGGPSGGDGGRGGDIVFVADPGLSTLLDFTHQRVLRAPAGEPGRGADCYGRGGADLTMRVPVGTQVFDEATGDLVADLSEPHARSVVARGGKGGRGNIHFATSFDRAPRRAEPGTPGEERDVRLELKVMADVGLLGFPNVGKSTFIRACSAARPKVADYPFTTLVPHLGVVAVDDDHSFVMADIPGLIPGAAEGAGLGIRFLKHVERTRALLHLITLDPSEGREPLADYDTLMGELAKFDPELAARPMIVVVSQADRPEVRDAFPAIAKGLKKRGHSARLISAVTGEGVRPLVYDLYRLIRGEPLAPPSAADVTDHDDESPTPAESSTREATERRARPKGRKAHAEARPTKAKRTTKTKSKSAKARAKASKAPPAKAKKVAKRAATPARKVTTKRGKKAVRAPKRKR